MEDLYVLNGSLEVTNVLDSFGSLIWTERYNAYGDFEITAPMSGKLYNMLAPDNYLHLRSSENLMIVEQAIIKTDIEKGDQLIVRGRSLESILERRIIWDQTILSGGLQTQIQTILVNAFISPTDPARAVANFEMELSTDLNILALLLDFQGRGKSVYNAIQDICKKEHLGFKVSLAPNNKLRFKLYFGVDRSANQFVNPRVTFSRKFDNLVSSDHEFNKSTLKTIALTLGAGEDPDRQEATAFPDAGGGSGLTRREMFVDASSISSKDETGTPIPTADYIAQLGQRGSEELTKHGVTNIFEAEILYQIGFTLGADYFLGDIVQIEDEYNNKKNVRVGEIIRSHNATGSSVYPTLENIEEL